MVKSITIGQVKQIAAEVAKSWQLVNKNDHYVVIEKATGKSSSRGDRKNLVSYHMLCKIQVLYLQMIDETPLYFAWETSGADVALSRKDYVFNIMYEVVRLLCGFTHQILTREKPL